MRASFGRLCWKPRWPVECEVIHRLDNIRLANPVKRNADERLILEHHNVWSRRRAPIPATTFGFRRAKGPKGNGRGENDEFVLNEQKLFSLFSFCLWPHHCASRHELAEVLVLPSDRKKTRKVGAGFS